LLCREIETNARVQVATRWPPSDRNAAPIPDKVAPSFSFDWRGRKHQPRCERGIAVAAWAIRKRYWGQRFWQRGYFSTTSGNITDDIIMRYLDRHTHKDGFSPSA
jgi:putative transposase